MDNEHWSALPSKARSAASDVLLLNGEGARRGTRELSGAWREHFCRACGAVVVRADHHCPFLATCIGAHNQAYFVALLLHMALSMTWGAGLIVPPAIACSSSIAQAASLPPPAPHGGGAAGEVPGAEALRRCRVIAPIGAGIVFLAGSLAFFLFCVLVLLAADLTIRECLLLDLLRYKAGPLVTLRRIADRGHGPWEALAAALGPPRKWWRLLIPCRQTSYANVVRLEMPSPDVLGREGVYWGLVPAPAGESSSV